MGLSVTVLGCSGTHPGPERMCSSYLIDAGGFRILADVGNGSLSNLQKVIDVGEVDALFLSHLHPDHFADIYGFYYALRFHPRGPLSVPVYAPVGAFAFVNQLLRDYDTFGEVCCFNTARAGDRLELGPATVTLFQANHPVDAMSLRVEHDGKVLTYSGDSATTPALVEAARDADLFMADATWLERERPLPADVHMTGYEAGQTATKAEVKRLLVTHVYPANDPLETAAEAARSYDGDIVVAYDLQELEL